MSNNGHPLQIANDYDRIDARRESRAKLYFQILNHFKGILDAWWRLQFGELPPSQNER